MTYANPSTNPYKTLPKDGPTRGKDSQKVNTFNAPSQGGNYGQNNVGGGFRGGRGGFNRGGMNQMGGGGFNNRSFSGPMGGSFQQSNPMGGGFQGNMGGGIQNFGGGFNNRGGMMGNNMRGGGGMRGGRGGGMNNGMMPMNNMGNMGMGNMNMGMGANMNPMMGMGMQGTSISDAKRDLYERFCTSAIPDHALADLLSAIGGFQGGNPNFNPGFFQNQNMGSDGSWNPHGAKRTRQE